MIEMTTYDSYLFDILSEVDGCPPIIAESEVRNTVIDFCKSTLIWKQDIDPIAVIANVNKYIMDIPEGIVSTITWGYMIDTNDCEIKLTGTSEDDLDAENTSRSWRTLTGVPSHYFMTAGGQVQITKIPELSYTMYLGGALIPSRDSYEAPTIIYNKYLETITAGARARLLNMKAQDWYNPAAAKEEERKYLQGKMDVKVETSRGNTRVNKSVVMRPIA